MTDNLEGDIQLKLDNFELNHCSSTAPPCISEVVYQEDTIKAVIDLENNSLPPRIDLGLLEDNAGVITSRVQALDLDIAWSEESTDDTNCHQRNVSYVLLYE